MKISAENRSISPFYSFVVIGIFMLFITSSLTPPSAYAQDNEAADVVGSMEQGEQAEQFDYGLDNRKDPFIPFIRERATTSDVDMNEIIDDDRLLTGMQLFEPGQLNLVALLKKGNQDVAMVEDFTGKGYVITIGTKIGRRGVVTDIGATKVLIEETAVTRAGRKIVTPIVMVLKKEGDE